MNRKVFALLMLTLGLTALASPVFAQGGAAAPSTVNWVAITSGFAMAIASSVCALAQGRAIAAACESLARNPGAAPAIRFALLLGLVLIESLGLYTLVIIFIKVINPTVPT
jgi:F-type H+-transporting ATPase subunit c